MARILVTYAMDESVLDHIRQYAQVDCFYDQITQDQIMEIIDQYDGILHRGTKITIDDALVRKASKLKAIGICRAGLDDVAVDTARERGIPVYNSGNCSLNAVAETTIFHLLNLSRKFMKNVQLAKEGHWTSRTPVGSFELAGRCLGIIGFGKIGRKVASIAQAFDMNVIAYDAFLPEGEEIHGVPMVSFEEVLRTSDIVSLHCPLTRETENLIDAKALQTMKEGACLLNLARGKIVDEEALYDALVSGHLAGAGLDALSSEPMEKGYKLAQLENVCITPHIGDCAENTQRKIATYVADCVLEHIGAKQKD